MIGLLSQRPCAPNRSGLTVAFVLLIAFINNSGIILRAQEVGNHPIGRSLGQLRQSIPELRKATKVEYTAGNHIPYVRCELGEGASSVSVAVYGPFNNVGAIQAISIVRGHDHLETVAKSMARVLAGATGEKRMPRLTAWLSNTLRETMSDYAAPQRGGNDIGWGTGEAVVGNDRETVIQGVRVKLTQSTEHAGLRRHLILLVIGKNVSDL